MSALRHRLVAQRAPVFQVGVLALLAVCRRHRLLLWVPRLHHLRYVLAEYFLRFALFEWHLLPPLLLRLIMESVTPPSKLVVRTLLLILRQSGLPLERLRCH